VHRLPADVLLRSATTVDLHDGSPFARRMSLLAALPIKPLVVPRLLTGGRALAPRPPFAPRGQRGGLPTNPDSALAAHLRRPCLWVIRCHAGHGPATRTASQPPIPSTGPARETSPGKRSLSRAKSPLENRSARDSSRGHRR
jgi:hypothetical protein